MSQSSRPVLLAVGAHPDDMDFGASGTIAKFIRDGYDVYYVLCTDGSRGSDDPDMTHEKLAQLRHDEQVTAGKVLGVKEYFFLGHPDTQLLANLTLKEELVRIIRKVRPRIVFGLDPTYFYSQEPGYNGSHFINHSDHREAAIATMDAVFPLCRDRLTFPLHEQEGLKPHVVEELWMVNRIESRHVVDITDMFQTKLDVIACHKSQYDNFEDVRKRTTYTAEKYGKEKGYTYAENFTRLLLPGHRK